MIFFYFLSPTFLRDLKFLTILSEGNQKCLKPMHVTQFVDFQRPKRGGKSRSGGSRKGVHSTFYAINLRNYQILTVNIIFRSP